MSLARRDVSGTNSPRILLNHQLVLSVLSDQKILPIRASDSDLLPLFLMIISDDFNNQTSNPRYLILDEKARLNDLLAILPKNNL